ncbi:MAG: translation initiation factor IF-6 [Candidatus Diapherotrites archaeon]
MEIEKATLIGSPYVGIFSVLTDKMCLLPVTESKEKVKFVSDFFDIEIFQANIANSALLGIFAAGNKKGFVISNIIEEYEMIIFENAGIKVMKVPEIIAVGNLSEFTDSKGFCSRAFSEKTKEKISKFLGIDIQYAEIAESDLIGSSLVATNNGFIMNPNASKKEFNKISKGLGVYGTAGTANYGDVFVGNSIIANTNSAIVGIQTSGHELIKIDEGLRGE